MNAPSQTTPPANAVEFHNVTKRFGETLANDAIALKVGTGTMHAVVGENGAGKSTLMRLLNGELRPDAGRIVVRGTPVTFRSPGDAIEAGIGMVHQHLSLVPSLNAVENIVLGVEPRKWGVVDWRAARGTVAALAKQQGVQLPLAEPVRNLPLSTRQHVEILKALYRKSSILILDEPTTVLDPKDYALLARTLRSYVAGGGTVLYVSHRLPEVFDLCDHVTVLRRGKVVASGATVDFTADALSAHIVGEELSTVAQRMTPTTDDTRSTLSLRDVRTRAHMGDSSLRGLSLDMRGGRIMGIAGVAGNGQTHFVQVLTGFERPQEGSVSYDGADWTGMNYRRRRARGFEWIPSDRDTGGLLSGFSIADNLVANRSGASPFARWGIRRGRAVIDEGADAISDFGIVPSAPELAVSSLSGGNQQKVLVARAMRTQPRVLLAEQPTRGVDIATARLIHDRLRLLSANGAIVIVVSSDLEELLSLCDDIAVLYQGRVVAVYTREDMTLGRLTAMLGRSAA